MNIARHIYEIWATCKAILRVLERLVEIEEMKTTKRDAQPSLLDSLQPEVDDKIRRWKAER